MAQNGFSIDAHTTSGAVYTFSNTTFSGTRNANSGDVTQVATDYLFGVNVSTNRGITTYQVTRLFLSFPLAGVKNNTWTASISMTGTGPVTSPGSTAALVQANKPGNVTNIATGDYRAGINGFVTGSSMAGNVTDLSSTLTTWSTSGVLNNSFSLNSTGLSFVKDPANSNLDVAVVNYTYDYLNVAPTGTTGEHFNRYIFDTISFPKNVPVLTGRYGISRVDVDNVDGKNNIYAINGITDANIYQVNGVIS